MSIADKRCFNHPDREVAIRCPECGRFYCRECTSEYLDRFLCKTCLDSLDTVIEKQRTSFWRLIKPWVGFISGFFLSWLLFYGLAQIIYTIPAYFHSGIIQHEEK